jgi:hypothetical protein
MLRVPHGTDNGSQMEAGLSALRTGRALLSRNIIFLLLVLISVSDWLNPRPSAAGRMR